MAALEAGDLPLARRLVREHIETVARHLGTRNASPDPINQLRRALDAPKSSGLFTQLVPSPTTTRASSRRRQEKAA